MAISIIDAQIPNALMSMLGDMTEIESQVQAMISWKRQIIGDGIDIRGGIPPIPVILAFLIWQAWKCRQLGWHRGMIARVIVPDRKATHLLVKRIPQGQIQLMAVVKLVVIPILIEVIILSLVPRERIRTTQSQMIGDKIEVQVSADGLSEVSASTSIPEKVDVNIGDIHLKEKSSDHDVYFSVDKLEATFSDPASTTDYYSVKVTRKQKYGNLKGVPKEGNRWQYDVYANNYQDYLNYLGREDEYEWCFDSLASNIVWPEMVTTSEPLINKKSELDDDFGFDEYKYFDDVYIFNDRTINGQTYTMHLEVNSNDSYWHTYDGWDRLFGFTYNVQLCKVTPEYYRFLKSINDAQSNSWADAGLMQVTPTYSNVKGGFGVVAGFNVCEASKYIAPLPSAPSDNQGGIYTK
jgi:hypothetical protein